jgi:uncharacterized membrane protein
MQRSTQIRIILHVIAFVIGVGGTAVLWLLLNH